MSFRHTSAMQVKTAIPNIVWPGVPTSENATLLAMQRQLQQSERMPLEEIQWLQFRQLGLLFEHAWKHSLWYRERLDQVNYRQGMKIDADFLCRLPILTRTELQQNLSEISCNRTPEEHGGISSVSTSGSTGKSITVYRTEVNQLMWMAQSMRDDIWHQREVGDKVAVIRFLGNTHEASTEYILDDWGSATAMAFKSGECAVKNVIDDVGEQVDWLLKERPQYLLTYPSNLRAICRILQSRDESLSIKVVVTMAEQLPDGLRQLCEEVLGAELQDVYSAQETGHLALQCPEQDHYHQLAEANYIEILDENDEPCLPGQTGRVVITSLHSFATPLIRYEVGDYAELGNACSCGRTLPVLNRVYGRARNMLRRPDGAYFWPMMEDGRFNAIADIRQYRLIQKTLDTLELQLVLSESLDYEQTRKMDDVLQESLGYPFKINYRYVDDIPRSASGKYEDFMSELD